jgi:adenylosuccinate synthase
LFDETGEEIRRIGKEFGAVTGRDRRCGWVDLVALKYAIMINGVTDLVMMKSDVLDGFDTIKVCVAYEKDGETVTEMPYDTEGWNPVYEELPGWKTPLSELRNESEFPAAFKSYIDYLEKALETPISIVSVSPDRDATIVR